MVVFNKWRFRNLNTLTSSRVHPKRSITVRLSLNQRSTSSFTGRWTRRARARAYAAARSSFAHALNHNDDPLPDSLPIDSLFSFQTKEKQNITMLMLFWLRSRFLSLRPSFYVGVQREEARRERKKAPKRPEGISFSSSYWSTYACLVPAQVEQAVGNRRRPRLSHLLQRVRKEGKKTLFAKIKRV